MRSRSMFLLALLLPAVALAADPVSFEELLSIRQIERARLSHDGSRVAWDLVPDRGDPSVQARAFGGGETVELHPADRPALSADGGWLAARRPVAFELISTGEAEGHEPGMWYQGLPGGEAQELDRVQSFAFAGREPWLGWLHHAPEPDSGATPEDGEPEARGELVLRHLPSGQELRFGEVARFDFAPDHPWLAFVSRHEDGGDRLQLLQLEPGARPAVVAGDSNTSFPELAWSEEAARLAWVGSAGEGGPRQLGSWDPTSGARLHGDALPDGKVVLEKPAPAWSRGGERLFFALGEAPAGEDGDAAADSSAFDPYDREAILADDTLVLWHHDAPRLPTHEEAQRKSEEGRGLVAVLHLEDGRVVPLATELWPELHRADNPRYALLSSDLPHRKAITWSGFYEDWATVDLRDGTVRPFARMLQEPPTLSPGGRHVAWFDDGNWHLQASGGGVVRNLSAGLGVPFADELHDYPAEATRYGSAGWLADGSALLAYDRYDLWQLPVDGSPARRLSEGRERQLVHRVVDTTPDREGLDPADTWLVEGYDDARKQDSWWRYDPRAAAWEELRSGEKLYGLVAVAEGAPRIVYTEERFDEFPNLWSTALEPFRPRQLSDANPGLDLSRWGDAQLVEWRSLDGLPLQGALFTPPGWDGDEPLPVLVYFYRYMSQRLHAFNEPVVNHRPSFPVYTSDGYAVFLPDVVFEEGRPGLAALKSVVPGVQKLVDMGVAHPDRVGLHGHSWSGYTSAYIITQTDLFAACVSGAPVSNMTSAYGGVRYESGLSRQFQYERWQSRLGVSLWEGRDHYIDNSPLFFADQIETPLLIQFGDEDGAVPWTQGIELYMAMRRLGKPCVFLQYGGEGHHLKVDANQLDYSIRMKEFLDHFCKGDPAPEWWTTPPGGSR